MVRAILVLACAALASCGMRSGPGSCPEGACGELSTDEDVPGADDDGAPDDEDDTTVDVEDSATEDGPSAGNEDVGCTSHEGCGAGNVCCTQSLQYVSECLSEAECTGGDPEHRGPIDACLTDAQCEARDPARPVCCHDMGNRSYCAPGIETCAPVLPCDSPADCGASDYGPCCSMHDYYRVTVCLPSFFSSTAGCP